SPYSVGLLYSSSYKFGGDSVIFIASMDGGATWGVRQQVAVDSTHLNYYRKVALSYGYSPSAGGRYFSAWESVDDLSNINGSIYTSRNDSVVSDPWIPVVNLDSITPWSAGMCRNP